MDSNVPWLGASYERVTGDLGQVANRRLVDAWKSRHREPAAVPIRDGVWQIVGVTGVNHTVIDAPDGLIVVDTGWNDSVGAQVRELLRTASRRPIAALVYSHSHFCFGADGLVPVCERAGLRVHAHHRVPANVARIVSHEEPGLYFLRMAQFGIPLPARGPDADPIGTPSGIVGPKRYLAPTDLWHENGAEGSIAGERVRVYTDYPFDMDDQLILHFPRLGVVVHGHQSRNLPNLASNGGGRFRDPQPWLDGLDLMLRIGPEHLLGVHGPHASGSAEVRRVLTEQRDALQYLYDQSVRGINRGQTPRETVDAMELPESLTRSPDLTENYAQWDYHVRAVYTGLINWYSGDAVDLLPIPERFESERMVEGFGGVSGMITTIRAERERGHHAWAAKLARHCVRARPDCAEARELLAASLREMGQGAYALTTRSVCLTQAQEWAGGPSRRALPMRSDASLADIAPPGAWVRALGFRLPPCRVAAPPCVLRVRFTDRDFVCGVCLRNGVAAYVEDTAVPEAADFSVDLPLALWLEVFFGQRSWTDALASRGAISPQSAPEWERFWRRFDPWPPYACA
jgi:alkyl sulfatase BDS1-like metallo-beta-lactamase superfamily hydrolase